MWNIDSIERGRRIATLEAENTDFKSALALVSGALVDAGNVQVPVDVMQYGEAVTYSINNLKALLNLPV